MACTVDGHSLCLPPGTAATHFAFREAMTTAKAKWDGVHRRYIFTGDPLKILGIQDDLAAEPAVEQIMSFACAREGDHVLVVGSQRGKVADAFRKAGALADCIEHEQLSASMCRANRHRIIFCEFLAQVAPDEGYDMAVVWPGAEGDVVAQVSHALTMVKSEAIVIAVVPVADAAAVFALVDDDSVFDADSDAQRTVILLQAPERVAPVQEASEEEAA